MISAKKNKAIGLMYREIKDKQHLQGELREKTRGKLIENMVNHNSR